MKVDHFDFYQFSLLIDFRVNNADYAYSGHSVVFLFKIYELKVFEEEFIITKTILDNVRGNYVKL